MGFVPTGTDLGVKLLMGLSSIDADLKRPDDVTNPINFDK
jgi:hypothetical protein